MKEPLHVFWEILLISASILVFRSVWLLLDRHLGVSYLWTLLFTGIIIACVSLYVLNPHVEER